MDDIQTVMIEFSNKLNQIFDSNLLSVILFGSAVLGDFRPGEGDLDFMVITRNDISDMDCQEIFDMHDLIRSGEMGLLAAQLEGTYYPLSIAKDPRNAVAKGCYVGTGRRGWKPINSNCNSMADYAIIRQHGVTCYGEEIQNRIYNPSRQELLDEIRQNLERNIENTSKFNSIGYALAMYHWAPRALCYVVTNELVSKRKAAEWYRSQFPDTDWAAMVSIAKDIRHCPLTPEDEARVDRQMADSIQNFLLHIRELISAC